MIAENYNIGIHVSGERKYINNIQSGKFSRKSILESILSSHYSDFVKNKLKIMIIKYPDNALDMFVKNYTQIVAALQKEEQISLQK